MSHFERFPVDQLQTLRQELRHSGLDSFHAAELIINFLAQRGYGVSPLDARQASTRMEYGTCTLPCLQKELENLALVM